jgi:hypothetical protein
LLDGCVVDCEAKDTADPDNVLQVQVVRAITDQNFWRTLNNQGAAQQSGVDALMLAADIENTIKTKAMRIAPGARSGLTLALDATLLPAVAFDHVIQEFRRQHGSLAASLGFTAIWLVDPLDDLVQKLDQTDLGNAPGN